MDGKVSRVDIGFVEKCEKWKLSSRFFPSKVGGKPAWLSLDNIPLKEDIECEYCKDPCIFLCQVYAPYEEDPKAFHRTIFIFICKNPECCKLNKNGNLKAFRSQLEKNNKFYPSEPPVESQEWRPDIVVESWTKSCQVCGLRAPSHCSKCKKVYYCCRQHQVYDWKHGHKNCCAIGLNLQENSLLLPEFELITEADEYSDEFSESDDEEDDDKKNVEEYEKLVLNDEAGSLQNEKNIDSDLLKMSATVDDEAFFEFTNKVKKYPDQILRYERDGKVLFISSENQPTEIPNCEECGGERQFEFQIMPQLLNYFQFEDTLTSLDWGILAVYTCKSSCTPKNGYTKEYVWKQDITDVGNKECS